jgi:hypothetical protein
MDSPRETHATDAAAGHDGCSFVTSLPATERGARNLVMLIVAMLLAACVAAAFRLSTAVSERRKELQDAAARLEDHGQRELPHDRVHEQPRRTSR